MAEYFFTEYLKLNTQLDTEAYGPVKGFEKNKYRVTTKITSSSAANAYAVTSGKVLVQSNNDHVNLLLFPKDPSQTGFTPVLFYIYRGLKKENFLDSNDKIVALNSPESTALTNQIWEDFNYQKTKEQDIGTEPSVKTIGWNYNSAPEGKLILDVFNNPDPLIEIADVKAGDFIGVFEGSETIPIGFEIVLKDKFYDYTLKDLRSDELIIAPVYIPEDADIPGRLSMQHMRERENILNFVDPVAYFNIHYQLKAKSGSSETTYAQLEIAQHLSDKFVTSKTVYIDIRNENGYSLNYYKDFEGSPVNPDYGNHIKTGISSTTLTPKNYYVNHWPIYTTSFNSANDYQNIWLSLSDEFSSFPFIYYDCVFHMANGNFEEIITPKFKPLFDTVNNWTAPFTICIPVNANNSIAWLNKIYVGRTEYSLSLPVTSPKKAHYLDYLFGPIHEVSSVPPAIGTKWATSFGKKLVYLKPFKLKCAVEVVISETNDKISFLLNIVDFFASSSSFSALPSQTGISLDSISVMGKISDPEYIWDSDKTKVDIRIKPILIENTNVVTYLYDDDSRDKPALCHLIIDREEFTEYILPAINNIDQTIHDVTLSIAGISGAGPTTQAVLAQVIDTNGTPYYKGLLRLKGVADNALPAIDNPLQPITILTIDGVFFQSLSNIVIPENKDDVTDPKAFFTTDQFIDYIKKIEKSYFSEIDPNSIQGDTDYNLAQTTTRIRVHSYGMQAKKSSILDIQAIGAQIAFHNLIADAPDEYLSSTIPGVREDRYLNKNRFLEYPDVFEAITSNADENGFQDNPSPYVNTPTQAYKIDMGQILFGFESNLWPEMGGGYYGYNTYKLYNNADYKDNLPFEYADATTHPIKLISYDYSGFMANVATPPAEYFFHLKKGTSPQAGVSVPLTADLDFYYAISAPTADLFGNADALGIYMAYLNLVDNINNTNLRLSDVLTLYYNGAASLRNHISLGSNPPKRFYQVKDRWKNVGIYLGFLAVAGSSYTWWPDTPSDPTWQVIRNKYLNTMWVFTEFWYNKLCTENYFDKFYFASRITKNSPSPIRRLKYVSDAADLLDTDFDSEDYSPANHIGAKREDDIIKDAIVYCLDQKFIPFLKAKIVEEGVSF